MVLFEGRDTAGKDGDIKRITRAQSSYVPGRRDPNAERARATQWYFQRYVAHLPAAGEIALFDRSWYNRAGVERVLGFCTEAEYEEFLRSCPFRAGPTERGIILIKYWLSVSDEEQERRFKKRLQTRQALEVSRSTYRVEPRWVDYAEAKDRMFDYTDTESAPWHVVEADNKRTAAPEPHQPPALARPV